MKDRTEYEANLFAANLLIDEEEMLEMLKSGYDVAQTASSFQVNVNMLLIKLADMKGFDRERMLFLPQNSFLADIRDSAGSV